MTNYNIKYKLQSKDSVEDFLQTRNSVYFSVSLRYLLVTHLPLFPSFDVGFVPSTQLDLYGLEVPMLDQ